MKNYYEFLNKEFAKKSDVKVGDHLLFRGNLGNVKEDVKGKVAKVININKLKDYQKTIEYTLEFEEKLTQLNFYKGSKSIKSRKKTNLIVITNYQLRNSDIVTADIIDKIKSGKIIKFECSKEFDFLIKKMNFNITSLYNDMSYFDIDKKDSGIITYIPLNKYQAAIEDGGDFYKSRFRQQSKTGRILRKLNPQLTDPQIENCVNEYRATWDRWYGAGDDQIRVVTGDEITFWYHEKNYAYGGGTLNSSCMRHSNKQQRVSFYALNPDKVALCILVNEKKQLEARALVWRLDSPPGIVFMDRIYSTKAMYSKMLKDYAASKGWKTKVSGWHFNKRMQINDVKKQYGVNTPYMDTFGYNGSDTKGNLKY